MKQKLLLLAFTLIGTMLFSQSVPMAFTDWWTNLGTQHMFQKNVTKTDGSNTFTGGATLNVNGKYDGFLTKINSSGTVIFTVQINGTANNHDFIAGMYLSGSDVYVTGTITNSVTMLPELFIAKYNSSGTQQFFTTFSNGYGDLGKDIVINASTGYIVVTGASYNSNFDSDISTIAFNSSGVQQWASFYNHANLNDGGFKITTKNAFVTVIAPITISTNNYKLASITYSASNGVQSGSVTTGATATSSVEIISDVVGDGSGNLYLCGATQQNAGQGYDMYIAKVTNTLGIVYETTINGFSGSSLDDFARGIQVDGSSNVYVTGITTHSTQGKNITTVKLNSSGVVQWTKNINGSYNGNDGATDLAIDASANVYVTGFQTIGTGNTDIYSAKLDNSTGNIIWEKLEAYPLNDEGTNLILDNNDVIVAGSHEKTIGVYEYVTYKYVQKDIITPTEVNGQVNDKTFLFYENIGQEMNESLAAISSKKFVTNSSPKYYFTGNNMSMVFASAYADSNKVDTIHRIDLNFEGSLSDNKIYGYEEYGINTNYILGQLSEPKIAPKGNQRMVISELYTGIDLQYYSNKDGGLKYYFVVKPGADPRDIIQYFNSTSYTTAINGSNELVITSSVGKITLGQPLAYQLTSAGTPTALAGSSYWHTYATNKYDFNLPAYTSSLTLIIIVNQVSKQSSISSVGIGNLNWSTFSGGGADDQAWAVAVGGNGEQHIAGATSSINYPSTGFQIAQNGSIFTNNRYAFYQKFDVQHKLILSYYIGGNDQTDAFDVAVNSSNEAYVIGTTQVLNFMTKNKAGAYNDNTPGSTNPLTKEDCFITKFDANGAYVWGTYFGGTNNDNARSCTFDSADNLYIVGTSKNNTMPLVPNGSAYQDAFNGAVDVIIAKFNSNDTLKYFTYYGDTNLDYAYSCKTDASNNLFVSGATYSSNFPTYRASSSYYKDSTLSGTIDMFMLKFNSSGVRQWATYFGGTGEEASLYYPSHNGIAIDQSQNVYFADNTTSTDMFTKRSSGTCYYDSTFGGRIDAFILKFNSSLVPQYCTYVGGTDYDYAHAIAFDSNSNLYLSYGTSNTGITTKTLGNYYNQSSMNGPGTAVYAADNFLFSLYSNLNPRWATYFGGTSYNAQGDEGTDIAIEGNDMYLVGYCNSYPAAPTTDIRFPIFYPGNPAYIDSTYNDQAQANTADAFISLFDLSQIVGIEEFHKDKNDGSLFLFPNPTNSALNVKFNANKQEKIKLSIFTIDGKLVFETPYPTVEGMNLIQINTGNLSTGLYIIKLDGHNYSATEKFVKYE